MGDSFSSFDKVGRSFNIRMKLFSLLLCAGLSFASVTKREADADADADPSYGHAIIGSTAPQCSLTPVKQCNPRQVEKPRKVCQTVVDVHEDTVVHETCEQVITTPVKNCHKTPVSRPRKIARVVCDTIVDVTTIQDCVETVTKTCTSSTTTQSAHSAVVGHDSQVVASGEQHGVVGHSVGPAQAGLSYSSGSAIGASGLALGSGIATGAIGTGYGYGK